MTEPVEIQPANIPDELKERDQWLLWDRSNDTPRQPHWNGDFAISWSNPDDWHSFDEAVELAQSVDSWGIGYVMAADNDDHARGIYGVIDLDGCAKGEYGSPKEWVPSLDVFAENDAYIEWSPSGTGLHIPIVGVEQPDWFTDQHFTDDEHEGVELLTHKFCTFTGNQLRSSGEDVVEMGDWLADWLREAYKSVSGDDPLERDRRSADPDTSGGRSEDFDDETVEEMLDYIDPDCSYSQWRDIGFALHDHFDGSQTGKRVFEDWSRDGSKWDDQAADYLDRIWDDATTGGGRTIGTVVYLAKQNGWTPSRSDGGATAAASASPDTGTTTADAGSDDKSVQQRVVDEVITPLNPPEDAEWDPISEETARERLTDILDEEYHFLRPRSDTRGWRDTLYVYSEDDGIYEPHGESFIEFEVERLMGQWSSNQRVREIVGKIERRSRVSKRELDTADERLVVANGILDLTTGDLEEHDPAEYHKTMIDVEYQPDAECPAIDEFLHDVVDDDDVDTLYRLIAHTLYQGYPGEKAAMLLGDGRNGKSVFLSLVEEFLGSWNVSNQSLQELNEDQWAASNLVGKLANVHPDMSDQTVETQQMFKKLTGNDTISADVKFEDPVKFQNHATLMFACNRMPVLQDDSRGNWRRWLLIDFPNTFEPGAEETEPKEQLMRRLTTDEELQGLLARCVEEISAWDDGRDWFPNAPDWEETRQRIRRAAEPVYDFAHACLTDAEDGFEVTEDVRQAYQNYATEEGLPTMSREAFGRKLQEQTDYAIEKKQKRIDGKREQVYAGITFTGRGEELVAAGVGTDDNSESSQSSFGGPQGRAAQIVQLCNEHADDDPVDHQFLLGLAMGEGMSREHAEAAIQKAKNQKDLIGTDGSYYPA